MYSLPKPVWDGMLVPWMGHLSALQGTAKHVTKSSWPWQKTWPNDHGELHAMAKNPSGRAWSSLVNAG